MPTQRSLFDDDSPPEREPEAPRIWSVEQLTAAIKGTLETRFADVWISGEISEVSQPQSGHIYFALKDAQAQIRGVMWRSTAVRLKFELEEGLQVVCRGSVDVYPPRGSYQLVVRSMEPQGLGALQLAFRQLMERLAKEGLFAPERKRPLPPFPKHVGFVTSPTGAAVHDFLQVAARRFPGVRIVIIPARVQGEGAAAEIVRGIAIAQQLQPSLDVLVVGRGGGSIEDLWCFNDERVVRAVAASRIPVVSAVGHEIDVTLCDLAADVRALTPSEAAERIIPASLELRDRVQGAQRRMTFALRRRLATARHALQLLAERPVFRRPFERILQTSRHVDDLAERLQLHWRRRFDLRRQQLLTAAARLEALNPLAVLRRGYSVTQTALERQVVSSAEQLGVGDQVRTQLARGAFVSRVEEIEP